MRKLKMLVLTDHSGHSAENALYPMVRELRIHPLCEQIDVASRGINENGLFFNHFLSKSLVVTKVDNGFAYHPDGLAFKRNIRREFLRSYDVVWLRLPPPIPNDFIGFLISEFPSQFFINDPIGIYTTGTKAFLMNHQALCPPMKVCSSTDHIREFAKQFPVVLKPFREYGGRGILKIENNIVHDGDIQTNIEDFLKSLEGKNIEYLGVKYLKNVLKGDKRIIVVKGHIMGAVLRKPAKDSWLCNVAQGGHSEYTDVDPEEQFIVSVINPLLEDLGIIMYGIDTLVDDDGKRVLSEINTTSIGGLPQMAKFAGKPLVKEASDLIWEYIVEKIYGKTPV